MTKRTRNNDNIYKILEEPKFYLFDGDIYRDIKCNSYNIIILNLTNEKLYTINDNTLLFLKQFNTIKEVEDEAAKINEFEPTAYKNMNETNNYLKLQYRDHPKEMNETTNKKHYLNIKKNIQKQKPSNPNDNINYTFNKCSYYSIPVRC